MFHLQITYEGTCACAQWKGPLSATAKSANALGCELSSFIQAVSWKDWPNSSLWIFPKYPKATKVGLTAILLLVAIPFPYTAVASHAWKQNADRQLFGPIVLSQHCMWCFTPCTRVSFRPSVPQSTGQHCATCTWSATGEVSTPDATTAWAPSSDTCWH